jgi:energy-coupling factor transporter ATP-binding protein EcfA2
MAHAAFSVLAAELAASLLRGRHLVLWGPRGAGKSTLLNAVLRELGNTHSALSPATGSLDDITRALERAYKETRTSGISRRAARSRLWWAADAAPGCILLDHVTRVPSAMKGCLRRLRGGVVGVILAVDVDSPRERERLRAMKLGCTSMRMPRSASRSLALLLNQSWENRAAFPLTASDKNTLVRAARGRPGWIMRCAARAADPRYWVDGLLHARLLALDTEMELRAPQSLTASPAALPTRLT